MGASFIAPRYQVTEASSPAEALALLPAVNPDLAILDVRMPEMDGFELTARMKHERPDLDGRIGAVTDSQRLGPGGQPLDERVV